MTSRQRLRPTLAEVAALAGVSTATVSNALNGTGRLSEQTRQQVLGAARALSYLPASRSSATARGGAGVLGLTLTTYGEMPVSYTEIPFYAQVVLSALATAADRGYLLLVLPATTSSWQWLTTPLDGVIHLEPRVDDRVAAILRQRALPLVSVGRPPAAGPRDAWVEADVEAATTALLDHCRRAGARRVGVVLPRHDDMYPAQVSAAHRDWCRRRRVAALVEEFDVTGYPDSERAAIRRLLDRDPRPDAVVGFYSDSGHHLLEAAAQQGLAVPADLLVGCVSDDPDYAHTDPPVTTVSLVPRDTGSVAVDLLLSLVHRRRGVQRQRLLPAALQPRRSTRRRAR